MKTELPRLIPAAILLFGIASCDSSPTDPGDSNNQDIPTSCEPSNTIELAVGESAELQGNAAALLCFQAAGAHSSYVLVATSSATTPGSFRFDAVGTGSAISPPTPSPGETAPVGAALDDATGAGLMEDFELHTRIREEAEAELAALLGAGGAVAAPPAFAPAAAPPAVGTILTLNASASASCSSTTNVSARVVVVSEKAIVVEDTGNPPGGFMQSDYQTFANFFDEFVHPLTAEYFGTHSDIDDNGRTILFFTKEVNRLTPPNTSSYTGGFFHPRDLHTNCAASNAGEILYLLVPDPNGSVNGNKRDYNFVHGITGSTMVHEQQHLINAATRILDLKQSSSEEVWLNEGLSHLAEELLFFRVASPLVPETDLRFQNLQFAARISAFNSYQAANFGRLKEYLEGPSLASPYHTGDGLDVRGASWSFLRYIVDRQPGGHAQFVRGLVRSANRGLTNLSAAVGGEATLFQWLTDWAVALYADNRVNGTSDRYQLRSWNVPNIFSSLNPPITNYPIVTFPLISGGSHTQQLVGGGSVYFRFGLGAGEEGSVKITHIGGGQAPPNTLRLTLLRTR